MNSVSYKRTKFACYFTNIVMASAFGLPPLLFATFREMYGISYTLLGTLVLVNFCTQLGVDLIFSFFSKHFNIHKAIRVMPLVTAGGLCIYAIIPMLFPQYAYVGLVVGTFVFSVAAGLGEVLISPTIAAMPSDTPEKDMSILHSLYGYGLVGVIIISTVFLRLIGNEYWMYLTFFWASLPVVASVLLMASPLPDMNTEHTNSKTTKSKFRSKGLALCVLCIFLGACAENTMTNWISVYSEAVLDIPKVWGDIFGMAVFALLLAITRSLYAKLGKDISKTLLISMIGSAVGYISIAIFTSSVISLIACVSVGVFSAMLWPGTLILMEEKIPAVGVAAYALMAASGDMGASLAPQMMGIIVDKVSASGFAQNLASSSAMTPDEIGLKTGMLIASVFPILGTLLLIYIFRTFSKKAKAAE